MLSSLLEFITTLPARVINFITVTTSEINPLPIESLLAGVFIFGFFYFPSKWFKAYLIRATLFILGVILFYDVMGRDRIIHSMDFYMSLGLLVPHIEIVELSYLIARERTLYLYDQIRAFIFWVLTPFRWLLNTYYKIFYFFQSKKEQREYKKQQQEEFKRQQQYHYEQEQQRYSEEDKQRQNNNQKKFEDKRKQKQKKQQQQQTKREKPKEESRWDSINPYVVLGISEDATKSEIKKAYRTLSKIYHPDLTMFDKEKHTVIFQKINGAYDKLK